MSDHLVGDDGFLHVFDPENEASRQVAMLLARSKTNIPKSAYDAAFCDGLLRVAFRASGDWWWPHPDTPDDVLRVQGVSFYCRAKHHQKMKEERRQRRG